VQRYRSDEEFLDEVLDAEDETTGTLRAAAVVQIEADAAMVAAKAAKAWALLMPVKTAEQREARRRALETAARRIALCRKTLDILGGVRDRNREARRFLRRVPSDLSDVYELIYEMLAFGRHLPEQAREYFDAIGGN
jgi:hypothetical protein